jgi:hypothetical protein
MIAIPLSSDAVWDLVILLVASVVGFLLMWSGRIVSKKEGAFLLAFYIGYILYRLI